MYARVGVWVCLGRARKELADQQTYRSEPVGNACCTSACLSSLWAWSADTIYIVVFSKLLSEAKKRLEVRLEDLKFELRKSEGLRETRCISPGLAMRI
jgi:hypothetical protein